MTNESLDRQSAQHLESLGARLAARIDSISAQIAALQEERGLATEQYRRLRALLDVLTVDVSGAIPVAETNRRWRFVGATIVEAAIAVIATSEEPVSTDTIEATLLSGGLQFESKNPRNSISAALSRDPRVEFNSSSGWTLRPGLRPPWGTPSSVRRALAAVFEAAPDRTMPKQTLRRQMVEGVPIEWVSPFLVDLTIDELVRAGFLRWVPPHQHEAGAQSTVVSHAPRIGLTEQGRRIIQGIKRPAPN